MSDVIYPLNIFSGGSFPRGHLSKGNYVGGKSSKREFSTGEFPEGYCPEAITFGVIVQEQ